METHAAHASKIHETAQWSDRMIIASIKEERWSSAGRDTKIHKHTHTHTYTCMYTNTTLGMRIHKHTHTHICNDDSIKHAFPVLIEKEKQDITAQFIFSHSRKHFPLFLKLHKTSFPWNCNFLKKVFLKRQYLANVAAENDLQVRFSEIENIKNNFQRGKKVSWGMYLTIKGDSDPAATAREKIPSFFLLQCYL